MIRGGGGGADIQMDQVSLRGRSIIERPTEGAGGRIRRPNVRERSARGRRGWHRGWRWGRAHRGGRGAGGSGCTESDRHGSLGARCGADCGLRQCQWGALGSHRLRRSPCSGTPLPGAAAAGMPGTASETGLDTALWIRRVWIRRVCVRRTGSGALHHK